MEMINPEKAAHNIATIFCEKFLSASSTGSYDPDSNDFYNQAKKAAQIYALVYDKSFETISAENSEE